MSFKDICLSLMKLRYIFLCVCCKCTHVVTLLELIIFIEYSKEA
jgi:hypothetical protein